MRAVQARQCVLIVTVVLIHNDRASVLMQPKGWRRWFRGDVFRYAKRTRLGWLWEDTDELIDDERIEQPLADALRSMRGY